MKTNESKELSGQQKSLHNFLKRRIHTLARDLGMSPEDYTAFLSQYGVDSSKDMSEEQLKDAVTVLLDRQTLKAVRAVDAIVVWRKRVMGAIGGWLRAEECEVTINMIKAIACRAARVGINDFNKIEKSKLIRIYNEFRCKASWRQSTRRGDNK